MLASLLHIVRITEKHPIIVVKSFRGIIWCTQLSIQNYVWQQLDVVYTATARTNDVGMNVLLILASSFLSNMPIIRLFLSSILPYITYTELSPFRLKSSTFLTIPFFTSQILFNSFFYRVEEIICSYWMQTDRHTLNRSK